MTTNEFESFRPSIIEAIETACVKSNDVATSYDWSVQKMLNAAAVKCGLGEMKDKLPTDFIKICKFEFQKLKEFVMDSGEFELRRSRVTYALANGSIEKRKVDTSAKRNISLDEQLLGATKIYSALGKRLPNVLGETKEKLQRQMRNVHKEIVQLRHEIEAQQALIAEVNKEAEVKTA